MEQLLHPDVRLRALLPPGFFEDSGRPDVVARFHRMFDFPSLELVRSSAEPAMDRLRLSYRIKQIATDGGVTVAEQLAFCDVEDGHVIAIDLLCSGDRPYEANAR